MERWHSGLLQAVCRFSGRFIGLIPVSEVRILPSPQPTPIRYSGQSTITDMEQERQELINLANAARTPAQIKVAKAALTEWYTAHPDDYEMNRLLGDLN